MLSALLKISNATLAGMLELRGDTVPDSDPLSGAVSSAIIIVCSILGLLFSALYAFHTAKITLTGKASEDPHEHLLVSEDGIGSKSVYQKVQEISTAISTGANAFLKAEYVYMGVFMFLFSIIIVVLIGAGDSWTNGIFTALAFNAGASTSIVSGFIGMRIAVYANARTTLQAREGYGPAFVTAFKAGCVMGFALVSLGVLVLYILMNLFKLQYSDVGTFDFKAFTNGPIEESLKQYNILEDTKAMFEAIAGYGLGGSSIALFGRVGGGIYTKAADVGADLCGKLEFDIPEDDPRNPAVIADNVGDNVGDVAGMGSDLFGSFAESTCAAMVVSASSPVLAQSWSYLTFPIIVSATGIVSCILTSFVATNLMVVKNQEGIEPSLKRQLVVSTLLQTPVIFLECWYFLPSDEFTVSTVNDAKSWKIFLCVASGLWAGLIIGYITEYYTSHAYTPVREVAASCETGAATNIIYGLALGYKSVIIPVFALAVTIYVSYTLAAMYGIAMAALGILSTMGIGLAIDAYGPICDNAGGIAEMAGMGKEIRDRTDALDAAGNTTAAIGKGFAIGSAALVSLALFGGFLTITDQTSHGVNILKSFVMAGLLVGAMLPYWFSALTMKSVGKAALAMVEEVRRQFAENPKILEGTETPEYAKCVAISTEASLKEMLPPGALVMLTPLIVGYLFGVEALAGVLAGSLVSGVQMAISASNTGGAWDNAKKYIECGMHGGKGSDPHRAAVVGDTVGDPLKDTSGPALNILIKLMAIISLVFARSFPSLEDGGYIEQLFN